MNAETLKELYVSELQDLYNAETQLVKALPKMAEGSGSPKLATAFRAHLDQTKGHVARLERILESLGEKPGGHTCKAMKGLVAEGDEILKAKGEDDVRDAGIIVAAQKVEHYEIAGYGSVCAFAKQLGRTEDLKLLKATLAEEKHADEALTELAESTINAEAAR